MTVDIPARDQILCRADLRSLGFGPRQIARAVARGELLRVRRDRYLTRPAPDLERAVRVGGRLACVSLLAAYGVFVFDGAHLHVHLDHSMSRLRSPDDAMHALGRRHRESLRLHWRRLLRPPQGLGMVDIFDALAQAVLCQAAWAAVATVDSVLHRGLMSASEVAEVFAGLPRRYLVVLRLADASAESGSETFMRLILRQLGLRYRTQVRIPGVGRVDFLVEGWLIVECDSKAHHEGWGAQRRDRRRDLAAAALGFATLRPLAEDLFFDRSTVVAAVRGLLGARRSRP